MKRKVKYDYAFKLECVELVLKKHYSDGYVSKLKQIPRWNIRSVSFIKLREIGLLPRINQSYSTEFKLKVVKIIEKQLFH
jgi:transposase